ncbi:hypothetical protein C7S13_0799 [Burkholderia cepacia]|nr:hypothetical protein [Burkholderia cepacia]
MQSRPLAGFLFTGITQYIKNYRSLIYKYLQAFDCAITSELIPPPLYPVNPE